MKVTKWGDENFIGRNVNIVKAVLSGSTYADQSVQYNISVERIRQIIAMFCCRANRTAFDLMPKSHMVNISWLRIHKDDFLPNLPEIKP